MPDPLKLPQVHPEAFKEGWEEFTKGATTALNPEAINSTLESMKDITMAGNACFKFFGTADSINELRKMLKYEWNVFRRNPTTKEEDDTYGHLGVGTKLGTGTLYIAHAVFTGLLGAAVLGAAVIAAPILTTVVSAIAFVKNIGEAIRAQLDVNHLEKEIAKSKKSLKEKNIAFENNLALHKDISESLTEINSLTKERDDIDKRIAEIEQFSSSKKDKDSDKDNPKIAKYLQQERAELQRRADKNEVIFAKTEKYSAIPASDLIRRYKIKSQAAQIELNQAKKANNTSEIARLEKKVQKYDVLKAHFEKIQKLEDTKSELQKERNNLDIKYSKAPYVGTKEGEDLKKSEKIYLNERIFLLNDSIKQKRSPQKDKAEALKKVSGYIDIVTQAPRDHIVGDKLKEQLQAQKEKLDKKIKEKQKTLDEKEKYVKLFSIDPKKQIEDAKGIFNQSVAIIEQENKLKIAKLERNRKVKNVFFAAAGLALAITAIVVWPIAATVGAAAIGVGIVAGISNLRDRYKKHKLEKELKKSTIELTDKLAKHLDAKLTESNKNKEVKSSELTDKLDGLLSKPKETDTPSLEPTRSRSLTSHDANENQDKTRAKSREDFMQQPKAPGTSNDVDKTKVRRNTL